MVKYRFAAALLLSLLIVVTGCRGTTTTLLPGPFGETTEDKAMLEALTEQYGEVGQVPRILAAIATTNIVNNIPVDKVSLYSIDAKRIYAWYAYDKFDQEVITVQWLHLDTSTVISTSETTAIGELGRGAFTLDRPADGWKTGRYQVVISGKDMQEIIEFQIIDGETETEPISLDDGKLNLPAGVVWRHEGTVPGRGWSPSLDYKILGANLGSLSVEAYYLHRYDRGQFKPGGLLEVSGTSTNNAVGRGGHVYSDGRTEDDVTLRVYIIVTEADGRQNMVADTGQVRFGPGNTIDYNISTIVPQDARTVVVVIMAMSCWSTNTYSNMAVNLWPPNYGK